MKIVVIDGTGLVGRPLFSLLQDAWYTTVIAARSHGIDAVTGEGLQLFVVPDHSSMPPRTGIST